MFYGTILGIFLVAIFIKSVNAKAVFWSAVVSECIVIILLIQDLISFLWLNLIGAILTVTLGVFFQKLLKKYK